MFRKKTGHFGVCNGGLMGSYCEPGCIRAQMILDQFVEGAQMSDYGRMKALTYDKTEVTQVIRQRENSGSTR